MSEEIKEKCACDESCDCGCQEDKECTCDCSCEHEGCTCEEDTCEHDECQCGKHEKKKKNKKEDKVEALENKIKELEDKILRDKAETINYRRRKDEEISRLLKFKDEDLVSEMLPIIDNFESAIKMDDDNLDDEVSKFLAGFKMIYCNLITILEKFDVKVIDGNNKPFDPSYHQAVMTEKCDMEPGMVIEVLRKGYMIKDKVLRPAMVKVSE